MAANRISRLPVAEFCGRSGELDTGSGRAAAMSSAFHALCEGDDAKAAKLLALLTADECQTIKTWHKPEKVTFDDGTELTYESAEKETTVGFDARGRFSLSESAIAIGHLDMAWRTKNGVYVGDIKKTRWTTLDGPESLQLAGYGFALAAREHVDTFACGLWIAEDGEWHWGKLVDLESSEAADLWARVKHAALNTGGDFRTGGHCRSCWSRMRCPAYLVPVEETHALAPLGGHDVTSTQALELLRAYERGKDTLEVVKGFLDEYARRFGIPSEDGKKKYAAVQCQGREALDKERVIAEVPDARERGWFKRGAPYEQMRWVKT